MQQSREKIKPILDVPIVLEMETVVGQETSSQYNGVEYRYNVVYDSRPSIIYLPAEGRDAIVRARPAVGDYLELLKQKRGNQILFRAQVLSDAYEQDPEPEPEPEPPPPAPRPRPNGYTNNGYTNGAPAAHGAPASASRLLAPVPHRTQPAARPAARPPHTAAGQAMPPRPEITSISPVAQQVAGCLRVAIDAWEELKAYAADRYGVTIEYSAEDVRATGTSIFIQRSGR
jgi:hypothetical protein